MLVCCWLLVAGCWFRSTLVTCQPPMDCCPPYQKVEKETPFIVLTTYCLQHQRAAHALSSYQLHNALYCTATRATMSASDLSMYFTPHPNPSIQSLPPVTDLVPCDGWWPWVQCKLKLVCKKHVEHETEMQIQNSTTKHFP